MLPGDLDGRRFIRAMGRLGWHIVRQRGSHVILAKPGHKQRIVVAFHGRVPRNTVRKTLQWADETEERFLEVY